MKIQLKLSYLLTISFLFVTTLSKAQNDKDFFTSPSKYNKTIDLRKNYSVDNSFETDDSEQLQKAINYVHENGGGRIYLREGNYAFANVYLKSNVHLKIDSSAVIRPAIRPDQRNYAIFWLKSKTKEQIENVSIYGYNGRFTFDLRYVNNPNVRCIQSSTVNNFLIGNFNVKDKKTIFSTTEFNGDTFDGKVYGPSNGVVKNISLYNAHFGYGVMQMHFGKHILFKNLFGEGGITLRFESHTKNFYHTDCMNYIDDMVGRNIISKNGSCALMLSPHFVKNGKVDMRHIESYGSSWAIRLSKGYANVAEQKVGLTPGYFSSESIIRDVKAYASTDNSAQIHTKHFKYVPCEHKETLPVVEWGHHVGPSLGAVLNITNYPFNFKKSYITETKGFNDDQIICSTIHNNCMKKASIKKKQRMRR